MARSLGSLKKNEHAWKRAHFSTSDHSRPTSRRHLELSGDNLQALVEIATSDELTEMHRKFEGNMDAEEGENRLLAG